MKTQGKRKMMTLKNAEIFSGGFSLEEYGLMERNEVLERDNEILRNCYEQMHAFLQNLKRRFPNTYEDLVHQYQLTPKV